MILLCLGCVGIAPPDTGAPVDTGAHTDIPAPSPTPPPSAPTAPPPLRSGVGSVSYVHEQDAQGERVAVRGVFLGHDSGFFNVAECWPIHMRSCLTDLPDDAHGVDLPYRFTPELHDFLDVGDHLILGGLRAQRRGDASIGTWYEGQSSGPASSLPVDLVIAGGSFTASDQGLGLTVPVLEHELPTLDEPAVLIDGESLRFVWEPSEEGAVLLTVLGGQEPGSVRLERVIPLPGTGEFFLDVDGLGLNTSNRSVEIILSRVVQEQVQVSGEPVDVTLRSDVRFEAVHPDLVGRQRVVGSDRCEHAEVLPVGRWFGSTQGSTNQYNPGNRGCTGRSSVGPDLVFRVATPAQAQLWVRTDRLQGDSALYLLDRCEEVETCVQGADYSALGMEALLVSNPTESVVYSNLILDSNSSAATLFTLDLSTAPIPPLSTAADSCAEAIEAPVVGPGTYGFSLVGAIDHLSPGFGGCGIDPSPGGDILLPIEVPPGTALRSQTNAPIMQYLLESCVDDSSCSAGASPYQELRYANRSSELYSGFLVLDDPGDPGSQGLFEVVLQNTPLQSAPMVDTCGEIAMVAPITAGFYLFDGGFQGLTDTLDLAASGPSCTRGNTAGSEGFLPVRLQAGEELRVRYEVEAPGDGALYLMRDCDRADTVVMCDDQRGVERLRYRNDTGSPEDLVLVLDGWQGPGVSDGPYSLEVEINH